LEIYDNPKTRFVASFIGENNFLPARAIQAGAGAAVVEVPGGRLELRTDRAGLTGPVDVAIRPQDIVMAEEPEAEGPGLSGTLVDIQFLGGTVRYALSVGEGHVIQVAGPSRAGAVLPAIGSRHILRVAPEAVRLYPREAA
jgi:spermidine/putrescine transport system ATP-binding protein